MESESTATIGDKPKLVTVPTITGTGTKTKQGKSLPSLDDDKYVDGWSFITDPDVDSIPLWGSSDTNLWASGESLMIFGPTGVGKSTLAHLLVWGLLGLNGPDVLGWPIAMTNNKVLYLSMDRPNQVARAMRRYAMSLGSVGRDVVTTKLDVRRGPLPVDIFKDNNTDWLCEEALKKKISVIVVDSIKDAIYDPSNEVSVAGYNRARQLCLANGIQLIELHHNRKANGQNKEPNQLDDVYGSHWLTAGAGSVINLYGRSNNPIVSMSQLKSPSGDFSPLDVTIDKITGQMARMECLSIETVLKACNNSRGMSAKEITLALGEPEDAIEKNRTALNRLVEKKILVKLGMGRNVTYQFSDLSQMSS